MIVAILVVCLAGFAQGLTGFGFGLVSIGLLPLLMNLKEAVAFSTLLNLIVCSMTFFSLRSHYRWRKGLDLVVGACLGVPIGFCLLVKFDEGFMLRLLGSLMLLLAINELIMARLKSVRLSPRFGFPFGVVSGGLSGAFNMGGPPAIAFTYSQPWSKEEIVATLQIIFGISAVMRLILAARAGLFSAHILRAGCWSVLPLVVSIALGQRYFKHVPQALLKKAAFLFLGAMGIKYLIFC
jgi:uncharacterized protein